MEQSQYIRANKGFSFLCAPREFCAAGVLLWGINPASFLYNWAIYAGVVLLWACFAAASEWKRFWKTVFHPAMLLSFVCGRCCSLSMRWPGMWSFRSTTF